MAGTLTPVCLCEESVSIERLAPHVAAALLGFTAGIASEVLPALQNLFLEGPQLSGILQECIKLSVTTKKLSDQLIIINPGSDNRFQSIIDKAPYALHQVLSACIPTFVYLRPLRSPSSSSPVTFGSL
jgi:hypothetical protein